MVEVAAQDMAPPGLGEDANQAARLLDRERLPQQAVEDAEQRRVRADGQTETQDGGEGEGRALPEQANRVAKVTKKRVHGVSRWYPPGPSATYTHVGAGWFSSPTRGTPDRSCLFV